LGIHLHRYKYK